MEVHHHPDVHHKKKKWKEYFLEGLMIFLAVTMGFIAENIRESIANKEKEKKYVSSLVENLKNDTANLNHAINFQIGIVNRMNSALSIPVSKLKNVNIQDTFFYHFIWFANWIAIFNQNDNTLTQLRNAGGFSIIQQGHSSDSITNYYSDYNRLLVDQQFYDYDFKKVLECSVAFIKYPVAVQLTDPVFNIIPANVEEFLFYDKNSIEKLYSLIRVEEGQLLLLNNDLKRHRLLAGDLIAYLKKEYHLQ